MAVVKFTAQTAVSHDDRYFFGAAASLLHMYVDLC